MTIRHFRALLSTVALLLLLIRPSISAETVELPAPLKGVYEGQPPRSLADLKLMESHQQKLAELTVACTVGIRVGASQGSGVIISADGYILTAAHVAGRPKVPCAIILPDGTIVRGITLGLNRTRDAGLVRITAETDDPGTDDSPAPDENKKPEPKDKQTDSGDEQKKPEKLKEQPSSKKKDEQQEKPTSVIDEESEEKEALKPADKSKSWRHLDMAPSDTVRQGMWCVATGHPGGYERGRRPVVRLGRVLFISPTVLRTDCVLVGGDSGGPLCDMQGRVIGIHSRIGGPITMNLHVPIKPFHDSWDRLADGESWGTLPGTRPPITGAVIGVQGDPDADEAVIESIEPGLPADKAGIQVGDVIRRFDGETVPDFATLRKLVRSHKPGDKVLVELRRGNETIQLKLEIGKRTGSGETK